MREGDGAYYVCSALYFTRIVGLSATQVGFGLTLGWAIGSLAALIITWGSPGWLVLGALFPLAGFAIGPAVRWAERSQQRARVGGDVHGVLP
jgi:hypothetical protein